MRYVGSTGETFHCPRRRKSNPFATRLEEKQQSKTKSIWHQQNQTTCITESLWARQALTTWPVRKSKVVANPELNAHITSQSWFSCCVRHRREPAAPVEVGARTNIGSVGPGVDDSCGSEARVKFRRRVDRATPEKHNQEDWCYTLQTMGQKIARHHCLAYCDEAYQAPNKNSQQNIQVTPSIIHLVPSFFTLTALVFHCVALFFGKMHRVWKKGPSLSLSEWYVSYATDWGQ